jgi:hypothetical protein
MAFQANINLVANDQRGEEILDKLEDHVRLGGELKEGGERCYMVTGQNVTPDFFLDALNEVAPDWREHIDHKQ